MEQLRAVLDEIQDINRVHKQPNEPIESLLSDMTHSKVSIPVIGKFSAGKSALLNTLLGFNKPLLKEDITPETAVPTEITFAPEDSVQVVHANKTIEHIAVASFRTLECEAGQIDSIRLLLRNTQLLAKVPDLMLVDMPGFESGNDVHNRAIDRYMPQSLAYCLAFPADDMVLKASMKSFLTELNLHQIPVCVVITKRDKVSDEILQENFDRLREDLSKYIDRPERMSYCTTSSHDGDAEELEQFLFDVQGQSQQLLSKKFRQSVLSEIERTASYLTTLLQNQSLSMSELEEQEDKLQSEMHALNNKIDEETGLLANQIPSITREIQADVRKSLQDAEGTLITMLLNNQEIDEKINLLIRESLTRSMQQRFLPKVQSYLKHVSESIQIKTFADMDLSVAIDTASLSRKILGGVIAGLSLIILGPITTLIGALVNYFISKGIQNKKREEAKGQIRLKLNSEVFPNIIEQVGSTVETELLKQVQELSDNIASQIALQRKALESALQELKLQRMEEQLTKEQLISKAKEHLIRIEALKHDI
jgi:Dynamin family.